MTFAVAEKIARGFALKPDGGWHRAGDKEFAVHVLLKRLAIAERIADALLVFEKNSYIGTPATKELMALVRDFKGIL